MQSNLTTLSNVQTWLGITTSADNALLTRLIASASRTILSYLQRPNLFQHACAETYDGAGGQRLMLRQWPVLSVNSLVVNSTSIAASPSFGQGGYTLEPWDGSPPGTPQMIALSGYVFSQGAGNVAVNYMAGYVVQNEAWTIPDSPYQVTVSAPYGNWGADAGVTVNGTPMALVTGTPATGQYTASNGKYTFAAADAGKAVLISYSYVPADIEQACIEMVGERYRAKDRIGEKSKTLGGQETVSFSTAAMNDYVRLMLQPFSKVTLC